MKRIAHGKKRTDDDPGGSKLWAGRWVPGKKKLDISLIVSIKVAMEEILMSVRKSNGQFSLTIPLKFAVKGGFDRCKYVAISQAKNNNLKVRRVDVGKNGGK